MIKSIPCDACKASGEIYNHVSGRYSKCRACQGEREIFPCDGFVSSGPAAMRNRPCNNCLATKRQHELLAELKAVQEQEINA
jgi:RecJ-like exonuclease